MASKEKLNEHIQALEEQLAGMVHNYNQQQIALFSIVRAAKDGKITVSKSTMDKIDPRDSLKVEIRNQPGGVTDIIFEYRRLGKLTPEERKRVDNGEQIQAALEQPSIAVVTDVREVAALTK